MTMLVLLILPLFVSQGPVETPRPSSTSNDDLSVGFLPQSSTPDPHGGVVVANVTVGAQPTAVAYNEANRYVYVTNSFSNSTSVLSGTTVVATIPVGYGPHGVIYDPKNGYVYVANLYSPSSSFSVINGTTVIATTPSRSPWGLAYDSANGFVYMTVTGGVWVINATSILAMITAGLGLYSFPHGIAYDVSNGYVYAADYGENMVHVIRGATVIANVTVGGEPEGVGYDSGNGYIYVTNVLDNTVSVINGTSVVATVPVGLGPQGVAYADSNGFVYVTGQNSNGLVGSLTVINDTTVVDTITVGDGPTGLGYDSANRYLYVATLGRDVRRPGVVNVISTTTDFQLSNGGPVSITAGQIGTVSVVTRLTSSPAVSVRLSCESPPLSISLGILCQTFSANPVTPDLKGATSLLTINVTSSVTPGNYILAVISTPLGETTTATSISVTVTPKSNLILGFDPTVFYAIIAGAGVASATALTIVYRMIRRRRSRGSSKSISNPGPGGTLAKAWVRLWGLFREPVRRSLLSWFRPAFCWPS